MKALNILKEINVMLPSEEQRELDEAIAELEAQETIIKDIEHKYHHVENDNARLTQKINGLQLKVNKALKWGRTQRDYSHKYYNELKALQAQNTCDGCVHIDHKTEAIDYQLPYPCRSCIRIATDLYCGEDDQ